MYCKETFQKLFLLLIILLSGCSNEKESQSELMFGLVPKESIDIVRSKVEAQNGSWRIIENRSQENAGNRPPFSILRVETSVFNDGGYAGKTQLAFFNKKLYSIWFYPDHFEKYKSYLKESKNIVVTSNNEKININKIRIRANKDYRGKFYVSWEFIPVLEEIDRWISKYS